MGIHHSAIVSAPSTPATPPRARLALRLRAVLAQPGRYFLVEPGTGECSFCYPEYYDIPGAVWPGKGIIEGLEKAVTRQIQRDYDKAAAYFKNTPRQLWDWLTDLERYATNYDPKEVEFFGKPFRNLSIPELYMLSGAIPAYTRLMETFETLNWWMGEDDYDPAWVKEAQYDLFAVLLARVKTHLELKKKERARQETLARYTYRPLTHRPFAKALAA